MMIVIRMRNTRQQCSTVLYTGYLENLWSVPLIRDQTCADLRIPLGTNGREGKLWEMRDGCGDEMMTNQHITGED